MTPRPAFRHRLSRKLRDIENELEKFRLELPPGKNLPRQVVEVVSHIHDQFLEPSLNVGSVMADCGISNHNFTTYFRAKMGLSMREYIETLRMKAACRLLRDEGIEIYLVAMSVGYDHPETFNRAFRRYSGCTPSAYRRLPPSLKGARG